MLFLGSDFGNETLFTQVDVALVRVEEAADMTLNKTSTLVGGAEISPSLTVLLDRPALNRRVHVQPHGD